MNADFKVKLDQKAYFAVKKDLTCQAKNEVQMPSAEKTNARAGTFNDWVNMKRGEKQCND
ncbi:MAG: hypothetical protein PVI00_01520 [Desulfobacterales bacterium]|jgi:hypothetical protein